MHDAAAVVVAAVMVLVVTAADAPKYRAVAGPSLLDLIIPVFEICRNAVLLAAVGRRRIAVVIVVGRRRWGVRGLRGGPARGLRLAPGSRVRRPWPHGGRLEVESARDAGTTIAAEVPV